MAINDKLNYLIETKQLFKDRLNSLGAEITSSTTFRNYLTWLDTFYEEVSNKTDLSVNGVVGRTSQNTAILPSEYTQVDYIRSTGGQYIDTGINADTNLRTILDISFINPTNANQTMGAINVGTPNKRYHILSGSNSIAFWVNDANYGIINSASTDRHLWDLNVPEGKVILDNTTTTTIPTNIANVKMNFWLFGRNSNATRYKGTFKLWACKMYYNGTLVRDFIPCYRNSDNEVGLYDIVNDVFYTNQGTGSFTYGSVVSIPNPDYPQPINNLSGDVPYKVSGKNLFDKNNANEIIGYFNIGISTISTSSQSRIIYIPCDANTTYTISKITTSRFYVAYTKTTPTLGTDVFGTLGESNKTTPITITTGSDAKYLVAFIYNTSYDTVTYQTILDSIQIEKGSTATDYEPYISQTFNIPLKSKNLANLDIIGRVPSVSNGQMIDFPNGVSSNFIEVDNTEEYIFQYDFSGTNERYIFFYDEDKNFISSISGENNVPSGVHINSFNSFSRSKYIKLRIDRRSNINWVQLEENSTPTDYEPYYDIELCDIDTYEDKIYSSDGRFYLYKNIKKVILNGSESWSYASSSDGNRFVCSTYTDTKIPSSLDVIGDLLSDKFIAESANDTSSSQNGIAIAGSGKLVLYYDALKSYTTGSFTTWISNNNVIVYYLLNTPTTTEITQENYPLLYNALKQIQDYLTAYKINKEFILGYSSPEIEY